VEPFRSSDFLPWGMFDRITDIRINDPDRPLRAARARMRRSKLTADGRLSLLAADHPARGVTAVGSK